jgi:DNA-binding transcriptional MerR regulator
MPRARSVLNAFTAKEVKEITGVSVHMVNYLAHEGYLTPTYDQEGIRGRVRFYSYRDLLVARIIQRFRESGLELSRLKAAIQLLSEDRAWLPKDRLPLELLATDGRKVYFHHQNGSLVELTRGRQQTFAFVLDVAKVQDEVKARIGAKKRKHFVLENLPLQYSEPRPTDVVRRPSRRARRAATGR